MKPTILSKEQRLAIYKNLLKAFKKPGKYYSGICDAVFLEYNLNINLTVRFEKLLPELLATKPQQIYDFRGFWFKEYLKAPRIKCIKQAIKTLTDQ